MSIEALQEKCLQHMEDKGLSQVKLAGKIGIGESTFSRWLKGTYPSPETITEKVKVYFEKEESRAAASSTGEIEFAMTSMSEKIMNVLDYCRFQRILGVIPGDAGVGKTFTCREWLRNKPDAVMLTVNPVFANPKSFLKLLARTLKTSRTGSSDEILLDIYDHLSVRDMTIVIDEAQHLTRRTLEIIRNINDETGTAIVLVGNETIYSKLTGKQQAEFAQLFSRIAMRSVNLLTDLFKPSDVRAVFGFEKDDEETDWAVDYLLKICKSKYGLRGAVHVYTNAKNNDDISQKGLKAMAAAMGIAV